MYALEFLGNYMKRIPSYSLNNTALFFGLNETDFIFIGGLFLIVLETFNKITFLPLFMLIGAVGCLSFLRLNFRRHILRDLFFHLITKRVHRVPLY